MKVFYLAQENFGCVVYADNENDAFEKIKCQRKELLETLGLPLDITRWGIVEFTPVLYDGVLCFYQNETGISRLEEIILWMICSFRDIVVT